MSSQLHDIFPERYHHILGSILPGGRNWHELVGECLESCPFDKCKDWGPSNKLCSTEWKKTPTKPIVWMVLKHIFYNFEYYDNGDLVEADVELKLSEISEILNFPFEESLTPSEARAIVKIRLKQAKFKANLFKLWGGCSLKDIDMPDRYLIASHIVPWSKSNEKEKVNAYNGLLLPPNYDYLFDRSLISFSHDGSMLFHDDTNIKKLYKEMGINRKVKLITIYKESIRFLEKHNNSFYETGIKLSNKEIKLAPKSGAAY